MRVMELLQASDIEQLITEADSNQITKSGNAGGELLDWITMFGAIAPVGAAAFLEAQIDWGHGYGAWHVD
jgi:hypothetical protein